MQPGNETARHGLILLGVLPPDKNVKPFSLNRTRAWEDKLRLEFVVPGEGRLQTFFANPATRMTSTVLAGALLIGAVLFLGFNTRTGLLRGSRWSLFGATPTFAGTATLENLGNLEGATEGAPTPLAVLLGISYTPTPAYVNTPRAGISAGEYRAAQAARVKGDWDTYERRMLEVQKLEPEAADVQYELAERFRQSGNCSKALLYYNESLKVDDGFAPGYLGLARARLCSEPGADVLQLLQLAQESDPAYGEVYLERANFRMRRKDYTTALTDLEQASRLMPNSALVDLSFAQVYLLQGNPTRSLSAAKRANATDRTLLPSYYYLGRAFIETGAYEQAIEPLRIYLIYETEDAGAHAMLGQALASTGDYRAAVDELNQALRLDRNQVSSFEYLGTAYLQLGNLAGAEVNFKRAIEYFPDSYASNIGLTEIYYRNGTYGSAYLQAETALSKATSDEERARALYWRALAHEGRESWLEALKDWNSLLALPARAMTEEMRTTAREHVRNLATPTRTSLAPSADNYAHADQ